MCHLWFRWTKTWDKHSLFEILKIFECRGYYNFLEDMPKLVEADVSVDMPKNEKLLRVLSSVEHLVICLYSSIVKPFKSLFSHNLGFIFSEDIICFQDLSNVAFCV